MDHSTAIQEQIANTGEKLVEIAEQLKNINNNPNIEGMKEHEKQQNCVIETLAYYYKFYNYARLCHLIPSDFDKLSKKAQKRAEEL